MSKNIKVWLLLKVSGKNLNFAIGRAALQVNDAAGQMAFYAVDGTTETGSCTGNWTNPWWAIDLSRPMYIRGLNITSDDQNREYLRWKNVLVKLLANSIITYPRT